MLGSGVSQAVGDESYEFGILAAGEGRRVCGVRMGRKRSCGDLELCSRPEGSELESGYGSEWEEAESLEGWETLHGVGKDGPAGDGARGLRGSDMLQAHRQCPSQDHMSLHGSSIY